jgi:hypothetical protein
MNHKNFTIISCFSSSFKSIFDLEDLDSTRVIGGRLLSLSFLDSLLRFSSVSSSSSSLAKTLCIVC